MESLIIDRFNTAIEWVVVHSPTIVAILIGMVIVMEVGSYLTKQAVTRTLSHNTDISTREHQKRIDTLSRVSSKSVKLLVLLVGIMIILSEVGLDIGPLLAAAGVMGVALGFGAQYLVNDIITGFFVLTENQYSVGDFVCINETCGAVESISLRMTVLRDLDGVVHHIPNSQIKVASNMSKKFSRINLDIGVSYDSDINHVIEVVNQVGEEMADDPEWADLIQETPRFLRIDSFADSAIIIKIFGEVKPAEQWGVTGELRKRLKAAFDESGIEIPFPQRTVHPVKEE